MDPDIYNLSLKKQISLLVEENKSCKREEKEKEACIKKFTTIPFDTENSTLNNLA